ncbi:DUF2268 domain-containing protein [Terribacillus sp. DMT04]|uniref:DUF2268 domain-containing protein n=1 Tax=Terribacillus sp. DMT04 TaxID=2850441 RepID=UPI001C2C5246|nr:DUF2268 domain-containing protein [Terribacillus sp. DMT04]QXE01491.1 DUF2268 domain-containing protein [Terribacillus sp. DMT04]
MSVIRTDEWLEDAYHDPLTICEKLVKHFEGASADEIYHHFKQHGMYHPLKKDKMVPDKAVWEIVQHDQEYLQEKWSGPDIPVYIFPSDITNKEIQTHFNGKSGLAFRDKLFLFISAKNTEEEIKAIFTHEYNHVCRLNNFEKCEEEYTLLDTIVLEGLAENAVRERLGEACTANWVSFYSDEELEKTLATYILPKKQILPQSREYQNILYGFRRYPKMLGYCTGYYLVKRYMEKNSLSSEDLLFVETSEIVGEN